MQMRFHIKYEILVSTLADQFFNQFSTDRVQISIDTKCGGFEFGNRKNRIFYSQISRICNLFQLSARLKYFKIRFGYVYKPYRDIFVTDNVYECFDEIRTVALIPGFYSEKALFSFFRNAIQMDSNLVYDRVEPVWSSTRWST